MHYVNEMFKQLGYDVQDINNIRKVKGMTSMNINPCFKNKKVLTHIADLIINYDYTDYSDLTDDDKGGIAALLNEVAGSSDEFSFIIESTHSDQMLNFFRKALNGTKADNENFLDSIKSNAIEYYDHTMESLFNYIYNDYQQSKREWLDHVAKYGDPDDAYDRYKEELI